jgi:hypothetical protein
MLAGVTVLFDAGGASAYAELGPALGAAPRGAVAVAAGLLFKAGAVPAQFWVPDVTEGAPAPVAALVTTVPKLGALVALYRLGSVALAGSPVDWPLLAAVVAAASMTWATRRRRRRRPQPAGPDRPGLLPGRLRGHQPGRIRGRGRAAPGPAAGGLRRPVPP